MDKKTILEKDIFEIISEFDLLIYDLIKKEDLMDNLLEEIKNKIYSYYDISDEETNLNNSKKYYIEKYMEKIIGNKVDECRERLFKLKDIEMKLVKLKELELPEQRSKEWYEIRNNLLTASSLADSLGKGHFTTRDNLLIDKTSKEEKPFYTNDIIQWGVKYEPTATTFYEKLNNLTIVELGLVPHPELKIFGASPDGICDIDSPNGYSGRMLEIKCPPRRQFTSEVPLHYWMQMQGQLESCDLEECDFLQVKLLEYHSEQDYIDDKFMENDKEKIGYASTGYPKGLVLTFLSKNDKNETVYEYEYSEFYQTYDELKEWSSKIILNYENKKGVYNWWKIERYECTLVLRDRKWWLETIPKIIEFWEEVEFYRKNGNQELLDKKEKRKRKKKPKKEEKKENVIEINKEVVESLKNDYLLDSDSD